LDFNELRQLLVTIDQTEIAELTLKSDDFELTVRKDAPVSTQALPVPEAMHQAVAPSGLTSNSPAAFSSASGSGVETVTSRVVDTTTTSVVQVPAAAHSSIEQRWEVISSPMVGTFYRAPAPNEPPFVEVGDRIRIGQTACIIEAMKLMNEIEAEVSGQVMEIMVQNGDPIEFGQPLMRVNPD
jgi:acetyl-CoA carboxylase biotin carboxyl carrier protein